MKLFGAKLFNSKMFRMKLIFGVEVEVVIEQPPVSPGGFPHRRPEEERQTAYLHFHMRVGKKSFRNTFEVTPKTAHVVQMKLTSLKSANERVSIAVDKFVVTPVRNFIKLFWR